MSKYQFECKCEACANDYPMFKHLPHMSLLPFNMLEPLLKIVHMKTACNYDANTLKLARKLQSDATKTLIKIKQHYATQDTQMLLQALYKCFMMFYMQKPLSVILVPNDD